jgi:tail tube protein
MAQAHASRHSISYVAESTFGTTPGTPTMLELRNNGSTLGLKKDSFVSEEIRNDRQIVDMRHGVRRVEGDISFELSYGAFDDFLAAVMFGAWATNVLKTGVAKTSFSIERAFADVSEYHQLTGCLINTMSLDIAPNAMITGSFGIFGKDMAVSATPLDASVTAAAANPPFDGFTGSLLEGGGAALITALSLNLNNNLNPTYVIGADSANEIIEGASVVTGEATFLFESEALLNKFLAETESSISVTLEGASGGDLTFLIPRLKYTGGDPDVSSSNEGILLRAPFQALRDSTEATNLKITRTPAA